MRPCVKLEARNDGAIILKRLFMGHGVAREMEGSSTQSTHWGLGYEVCLTCTVWSERNGTRSLMREWEWDVRLKNTTMLHNRPLGMATACAINECLRWGNTCCNLGSENLLRNRVKKRAQRVGFHPAARSNFQKCKSSAKIPYCLLALLWDVFKLTQLHFLQSAHL